VPDVRADALEHVAVIDFIKEVRKDSSFALEL